MNEARFSLEFFPPRSESAALAFNQSRRRLVDLNPSYVTVTYGAMGSARDLTLDVVRQLLDTCPDTSVGSHLTYLNKTRAELHGYADAAWNCGVRRMVALRGDLPDDLSLPLDPDRNYFQFTSQFVAQLAKWHPFTIHVGAYPEKHPDSANLDNDIETLKRKLDAGAHSAITQFFFDTDTYCNFVDQCHNKGIDKPIIPGLIPVHSFANICSFARKCQASIPPWLHDIFDGVADRSDHAIALATDVLTRQVLDLRHNGVTEFHFYTMNRHTILEDVINNALG